jgi:hypothetical protein
MSTEIPLLQSRIYGIALTLRIDFGIITSQEGSVRMIKAPISAHGIAADLVETCPSYPA